MISKDTTGAVDGSLLDGKSGFNGPTFEFRNRLKRAVWRVCQGSIFRLSPIPCHRYRLLLLRLWGARVSLLAYVYPDAQIWAPWNLELEDFATLGPKVDCYNVATVRLEARSIASQGVHLCTATHDYDDPNFRLYAMPITLKARSWACSGAFVGPGVTLHNGAILGARGVATQDVPEWTIYAGNPAKFRKQRERIEEN